MNDRMKWFHDAKVGMFAHWGPYSVAGVEASWPIMVRDWSWLTKGRKIKEAAYVALPKQFNPTSFNADDWVRTIQDAGLRYFVFTSKHHDGFCMFDAPGTDYKITNTPFGRDIVGELAEACDRAGLPFGLYYSPPDMNHPGFRDTSKPIYANWFGEPDRSEWKGYLEYMHSHLRHLLTQYGDIAILWFDGLFDLDKYRPAEVRNLIDSLSPDTLVNDRIGSEYDYITPEQGIPDGVPVKGNRFDDNAEEVFRRFVKALRTPILRRIVRRKLAEMSESLTPLQPVPTEVDPPDDRFQPWETCMTMNRSWAYNPADTDWKPTDTLIDVIKRCVERGGNLLLNVGPTPEGTFPEEATSRLSAIGAWLKEHGDEVYGRTYHDFGS